MVQHNDYSLVTRKYHLYPKSSFKASKIDWSHLLLLWLWISSFFPPAYSIVDGEFSSPFSPLCYWLWTVTEGQPSSTAFCCSSHWEFGCFGFNSRSSRAEFASPPCDCVGSLHCPKACKPSQLATLNCQLLWTSADSCLSIRVGPEMSWWFVRGVNPPSPQNSWESLQDPCYAEYGTNNVIK